MTKRPLGTSAIRIAPLALGGNVFGWTADEATSFEILDRFVDAGFDLVDTADVYSTWVPGHQGGESETVLGKWLAKSGKRERVMLATKVGMEIGGGKGLKKSRILACADDSLKRLRTDRIDLYQTHIDDPETPVEETLEALARLVKEGKVRAIGASQYSAERLDESLAASDRLDLPRYVSLQPNYNLCERAAFERSLPIAWVMAQPGITAPIASATSVAQLEELLAATRLHLDAGMLATLDRASRIDLAR